MKRIMKKLSTIYYDINLRTKLIISYLILIIIPVFFLVFFSYTNIHKSVVEQTGVVYMEALEQAEKNITFGIDIAYNIAYFTQADYKIQSILRTVSERELSVAEEIDFFNVLNNSIGSNENNNNVLKVSYFLKGSPAFVTSNPNFGNIEELKKEKVLKPLLEGKVYQAWYNENEFEELSLSKANEVIYIREIRDLANIKNILGYVMVEMDTKFIWNILSDIGNTAGVEKVVRKNMKIVNAGNLEQGTLTDAYVNSGLEDKGGINKFVSGKNYNVVIGSKVDGLDWDISLLMTEKQLGINSQWIRNFMLLLAAAILFLAIVTALLISGSITKRLKILVKLIKKAEKGNFEIDNNIKGNDEYAGLQRSFNKMSIKIKELIEEVYQAQISKQETEMKLLYAQINPHFLYNTLDIIQWSALRINAGEIAEVTEALAKYMRLSLNEGKESIKLEDEIEQVKGYMRIINYRYKDAINFQANIEEDCSSLTIIKMIIQPLIENAIVHGIRPKEGKSGTILLNAHRDDRLLYIEVHDDGVGIPRGSIDTILGNESSGYGTKNVHQRIQVYYGEECGLRFFSRPGIGCSAIIRLKI